MKGSKRKNKETLGILRLVATNGCCVAWKNKSKRRSYSMICLTIEDLTKKGYVSEFVRITEKGQKLLEKVKMRI